MKNKELIKKYLFAGVSFCFMIAIAGYINYKYDPEREKDLGQTVYVSSNADKVDIYEENNQSKDDAVKEEDKMTRFRNDRDSMYLELANNYSQIINNSNSSANMVEEYQEKLTNLIEEKNNILIIENIIKSKGIEDAVVMLTNSTEAHVLLKTESVEENVVAQIMQTIIDKLNISANNITIEKISI